MAIQRKRPGHAFKCRRVRRLLDRDDNVQEGKCPGELAGPDELRIHLPSPRGGIQLLRLAEMGHRMSTTVHTGRMLR